MFAATSWALKRLLKFVLKRNLKQWVATEIDLDQLEIQLGQGCLELREVLLNVEYINQQLEHTHWEVTSAFIGSVKAFIPLASLYQDSCSIQLSDIFITIQPRAQEAPSTAPTGPLKTEPPAVNAPLDSHDSVSDGIRIIAGGLESLLQRLKVQASNIVARIMLPSSSPTTRAALLVLSLEHGHYANSAEEGGLPADDPRLSSRALSFTGLTLGCKVDAEASGSARPLLVDEEGEGCAGSIALSFGLSEGPDPHPTASVSVDLGRVSMLLGAGGLATLHRLATVLQRQLGGGEGGAASRTEPTATAPDGGHAWASRSLLESLMLPDCEDLVVEALADSETGLEELEEEEVRFWDARSLHGSVSSAASQYESVYSNVVASVMTAQRQAIAPDKTLSRLHDLTASIRVVAAPLQWSLLARVPEVETVLQYPGASTRLLLTMTNVHANAKGQGADVMVATTLRSIQLVEERQVGHATPDNADISACAGLPSTFSSCPDFCRREEGRGPSLAALASLHFDDEEYASALKRCTLVDVTDCKEAFVRLHAASALRMAILPAAPSLPTQIFTSLRLSAATITWLPEAFEAKPLIQVSAQGQGVWKHSEPEALCSSLEPELQEQCLHCVKISGLRVSVVLSAATLQPLPPLLEAYLALVPSPTLGIATAAQNCVSIDATADVVLCDARFCAEVKDFHGFLVSGLARTPGASAALLELTGVTLQARPGGEMLLLSRAQVMQSPNRAPTLSFLHLSRQTEGTVVSNGRRLVFPTKSIGLVQIRECTLGLLDGDPAFKWVADICALLAPPPSAPAAGPAPAGRTDWSVQLESVAIRYEPPGDAPAPAAAAVLRAGTASWRSPAADHRHGLSLGCLELHVAAAQTRDAARWARSAALPAWDADLAADGYLLLAREAELRVELPTDQALAPTLLSNHLLTLAMSARAVQLAQRLVRQLIASVRTETEAGQQGVESGAARAIPPSADVLAGVDEDAFREARHPTLGRSGGMLAASVFMDGGFYQDIATEPLSPAGSPPVLVDSEAAWQELENAGSLDDGQNGTWFGSTNLVDDYVMTPPPQGQLGAGSSDNDAAEDRLSLRCSLNVDVSLVASSGKLLMIHLQGLDIMVERPEEGEAELSSPATKIRLRSLEVKDGVGRPVLSRLPALPTSRAVAAPALSAILHAVTAGGEAEYRIVAALAPLRLQLRRRSMDAMRDLLVDSADTADFDEDFGARLVDWDGWEGGKDPETNDGIEGESDGTPPWPFIQHFILKPVVVVLDHAASAINLQALRAGSFNELLHLVPLGGVRLTYRELRLVGVAGLPALGSAIANAYLRETSRQAHKFVGGTQPIRPLVRVAGAASAAVAGPLASFSKAHNRRFAWEVSRGVKSVASAILDEALGAAGAAAGTAAGRLDGQAATAAGALQRTLKEARVMLDAQPRR